MTEIGLCLVSHRRLIVRVISHIIIWIQYQLINLSNNTTNEVFLYPRGHHSGLIQHHLTDLSNDINDDIKWKLQPGKAFGILDTESRFISTCFIQGNINTRIFNARRGTNPPLSPSGICKRRFAPVYTYVWFYFNELTPAPSGALYLSFINISQSKSFLELPVRLLNLMRKLIRCQFTSRYMGGGLFRKRHWECSTKKM